MFTQKYTFHQVKIKPFPSSLRNLKPKVVKNHPESKKDSKKTRKPIKGKATTVRGQSQRS
jgi:hypothetical protein